MNTKVNIKQLVKALKDEPLFGIKKDGKDTLLYTQHFMLSGKDKDVDLFIETLETLYHVKDGKMYTWGLYGIRPYDYNTPINAVELYHTYLDAPRCSAKYTLHAYTGSIGEVVGHVFVTDGAENKVLPEHFFKMFGYDHDCEFTHVAGTAFVVDGKHIVAPLNVYRTRGFKVVKIGAIENEED